MSDGVRGLSAPRGESAPLLALLAGALLPRAGAGTYASLKSGLVDVVRRDPFDAAVATVLGGALLFYLAEKGKNPKVTSYWDGLVFVSTCLSVGYADVFARTPAGKAIASAVMTIGPALSGAIFDPPRAEGPGAGGEGATPLPREALAIQTAILSKLDAILGELRAA